MDKDAYAARAERMKSRLYATALLHMGSETMAIDAVDEAIYRGLISVKKLRQPEYFETWMTRILINECNKAWRRAKREQPLETIPESAEEEQRFDALPLKEAIGQLPRDLREVVILRYFSGFTIAETARCLEIPQGTAATRQRRALQLLKLELSEEEES